MQTYFAKNLHKYGTVANFAPDLRDRQRGMFYKGFVKGIMLPLAEGRKTAKAATLSAAVSIAAMSIGLCSCGSGRDDEDGKQDSVIAQPPIQADTLEPTSTFIPDNDIAMTVRSVADAINVGEAIDSVEYAFKGVLTDGTGMPLFTDIDGLPGEWEVEVISPYVVQIRNVNSGDLISDDLVGYIAAALQLDDDDTLELVDEENLDDRKVSVFSFGKGTLTVETSANLDKEANPGDRILITMRAAHEQPSVTTTALPSDTVTATEALTPR